LQETLLQPSAALAAFHPTTGAPGAYQLLLSCLQDGCLPAAQQLLLLQLLHSMQQHTPQPAQDAGSAPVITACSSSSSSSNDAVPALIWPEFVLHRLAGLAVSAEPDAATAGVLGALCFYVLLQACASRFNFIETVSACIGSCISA
jgi:hypothetical protein